MNITRVTIEPPPSRFDYSTLDATIAETVRATVRRIKTRMRDAFIEVGRDLLKVKAMLDHGTFGRWLDAEFEMTHRTAQNYMNAAGLVDGKGEIVSHLPPAVLYRLAAPSIPETVRDNVIARLRKGDSISSKDICTLAASARSEKAAALCEARVSAKQLKRAKHSKEQREAHELERQKSDEEERQSALQAIVILRDRLAGDLFKQFAELVQRSPMRFISELSAELGAVRTKPPLARGGRRAPRSPRFQEAAG